MTACGFDIARHWIKTHPPKGGYKPSRMGCGLFVEAFGDIFEHTPQVAERSHALGLTHAQDSADGLHARMVEVMRQMSEAEKLALIVAHPDLAGRLALAKQLTADSANEQGSVGLDRLTPAELEKFTTLNNSYRSRFGFPFIFAVKGKTKDDIIASFEARINNSKDEEFAEALRQIERIALLRLKDRLPA